MDQSNSNICVLEVRAVDEPEGIAPLAWLLVERCVEFRHEANGALRDAKICLSCRVIDKQFSRKERRTTYFHGAYAPSFGVVSLTASSVTTGGYVVIENSFLKGHRIGTYLMNEIVKWVQQWPEASVNTVKLLSSQADSVNKVRRNRFYEQFGLSFDYDDAEQTKGTSRDVLVKQLNLVDTWKKNISVHSTQDYLARVLFEQERDSSELVQRDRAVKELIAERRANEAAPMRWALGQLFRLYPGKALVTTMFCAVALILGVNEAMQWWMRTLG